MPFIDEEPIVTVQIESELCAYEVAVNEVPILKGPEGYPISVEIPVNHWLVSGKNVLGLAVGPSPDYPGGDEDANCEVTLYARRNGAPREQRKEITKLSWSAADGPSMDGPNVPASGSDASAGKGDDEVGKKQKGLDVLAVGAVESGGGGDAPSAEEAQSAEPPETRQSAEGESDVEVPGRAPNADDLASTAKEKAPEVELPDGSESLAGKLGGGAAGGASGGSVVLSRVVELSLPLPEWAWVTAEPVEANDETRAVLLPLYEEAWNLLSAGDWAGLVERSSTKVGELAAAFYEELDVMEQELAYEQLVNNHDVELHAWEPEDLEVEVFAGGRLARLARWDGEAPLIFVYTDKSAAHYLDVVYCKTAFGWLIIR
jgi:hypothetical protein